MPGISFYLEEEEMRKEKSIVWVVMAIFVVASMLLASCAPATTATEAPPAVTDAPTDVATEPATGEATEAPAATGEATEPAVDRNYSPEIPDPTEPVTITFASFNDLETPFWQGMRDEFEAVHPNIKVEFEVTTR
jgi:ABC-type glycerol-3-phosphate transport system substrate-binding protein